MPDVVFLSSVFGEVKLAEPMGVCILTAALRKCGITVQIVEPSIEGLTEEESAEIVCSIDAPIVALSVLRDKHVDVVLRFTRILRQKCPERFVILGGHGPSIAVNDIEDSHHVWQWAVEEASMQEPLQINNSVKDSFNNYGLVPNTGPIVNRNLVDRGKGPGDTSSDGAATIAQSGPSIYYNRSAEYIKILANIDTYMLGEADSNLPILVKRVLANEDWRDVPGLAYLNESNHLVKTPPPPKIRDLGSLPYMARDVLVCYYEKYNYSVPASLLATRGCFYRCTFCSVVQYELLQDGLKHRQRPNADIVDEILSLNRVHGTTDFNFEDDNFIVGSPRGKAKLYDLCDSLRTLPFKPSFTFFCRADAVDYELFRCFREVGLSGIYFGMESVHQADLEFFHKGASESDNFRALDILYDLDFSVEVDASLRIMLGYITWHPKTSLASLRETAKFVRTYSAPPKLLRRKLRLYTGTEAIQQVKDMGLINPSHPHGWDFEDARMEALYSVVDGFQNEVNQIRDRIRTLEKAAKEHKFDVLDVDFLKERRTQLDALLYSYFEDALLVVDGLDPGEDSVSALNLHDTRMRSEFSEFIAKHRIEDVISDGYSRCGFKEKAVDLFRK